MTLIHTSREHYKYFSESASTICRHLGFAGIVLIWVFKVDRDGARVVPAGLVRPAILIVGSLTLDLLQYVLGALIWGFYSRRLEVRHGGGKQIPDVAPPCFNWPGLVCFWIKIVLTVISYVVILAYLARTVLSGGVP